MRRQPDASHHETQRSTQASKGSALVGQAGARIWISADPKDRSWPPYLAHCADATASNSQPRASVGYRCPLTYGTVS